MTTQPQRERELQKRLDGWKSGGGQNLHCWDQHDGEYLLAALTEARKRLGDVEAEREVVHMDEYQAVQEQLTEARERAEMLEAEAGYHGAKEVIAQLTQRAEQAERSLDNAAVSIQNQRKELARLNGQVSSLTAQLAEAQAEVARFRESDRLLYRIAEVVNPQASYQESCQLLGDIRKLVAELNHLRTEAGRSAGEFRDALLTYFPLGDETALERFERVGEMYRKETGRLRPGKDEPMVSANMDERDRQAAFQKWLDEKRAPITKLLAALTPSAQGGEHG